MQPGTDQHDMTVELHSGFLLGRLELLRVDVAEIGNVPQVEARGLADEHVERHLVDAGAAALDVTERVDVGSDVIHHRDEGRAAAERILGRAVAPGLHLVVGEMRKDDRPRKELVRRHVVGERHRQVDDRPSHDVYPNPSVRLQRGTKRASVMRPALLFALSGYTWQIKSRSGAEPPRSRMKYGA